MGKARCLLVWTTLMFFIFTNLYVPRKQILEIKMYHIQLYILMYKLFVGSYMRSVY